jgi:hypothetical protein
MKIKYESRFKTEKIKSTKRKIKGGAEDYDFNTLEFKQAFLQVCKYIGFSNQQQNFKVLYKKMYTLGLILFGKELISIKDSYYLPYIYYLFKNTVKFKKIIQNNTGGFTFEELTDKELQEEILKLINILNDPKKNFMSNNKNENYRNLVNKLNNYFQAMQYQVTKPQYSQQTQQYPYQVMQFPQQTQQNPYQAMQSPQQSPQMQTQLKINFLTKELNNIISQQNILLGEIKQGVNPSQNQQKVLQELLISQQQLKTQINQELDKLQTNPITQNIQKQVKNKQQRNLTNQLQKLNSAEKEIKELQKKQIFNISKQNLTNQYNLYRCQDPSLEVKIQDDRNIFFGYNEYLFAQAQNGSYKLYYKYSYRNGIFYQLIKKQDGTFEEKEININLIPIYDILRLNQSIKGLQNRQELQQKLSNRIEIAKQNISNTGEAFFKLDHANFDKEKRQTKNSVLTENQKKITSSEYKNFGKVKKRQVTGKTYIFFGAKLSNNSSRNSPTFFSYVGFREGNKVFYYAKSDLKKEINLNEFPYIYPLEDLISFILLRRMITKDDSFADVIYKEAEARIKFLKTNKFTDKMLKQQFPQNYQNWFHNTLHATQNYKNIIQKNRLSKLPVSPIPIQNSEILKLFESF